MKSEIPDFASWLEVKSASTKEFFDDGTIFLEVRRYEKMCDNKKIQIGSTMNFFGKEVLKIWSIFISDEEVLLKAIKTDSGKWEVGLPTLKEDPDGSEKGKVVISVHIRGEKNPYVKVSMPVMDGTIIERKIFKHNDPPKK